MTKIRSLFVLIRSLLLCLWMNRHCDVRGQDDCAAVIFTSTGGGIRAMFANMGVANIFDQAGLFDTTSTNNTCSRVTSISSQSGGTWFTLQFFYSDIFYKKTLSNSSEEVADFVGNWLQAFADFSRSYEPKESRNLICLALKFVSADVSSFCALVVILEGYWAEYMRSKFKFISESFGDDGLADRPLTVENRIAALQNVDHYMLLSLAPNSAGRKNILQREDGFISFISPANDSSKVFAAPIPVQLVVPSGTSEGAYYRFGVEDSLLPLQTVTTRRPDEFRFRDWEPFYLEFPIDPNNLNGIYAKSIPFEPTDEVRTLQPFFLNGNDPSVTATTFGQIAGATTGFGAKLTSLPPSYFAQYWFGEIFRRQEQSDKGLIRTRLESVAVRRIVKLLYDRIDILDEFAVCSQWPNPCGTGDGRFLDGLNSDPLTMGMNIGEYHRKNGVSDKPIKAFHMFNFGGSTNTEFLAYFNTTFTDGIEPGEIYWRPSENSVLSQAPRRSIQIFRDYLDEEIIAEKELMLPGLNMTTFTFNATTVDNPMFGVQAGQSVEIFYIQLNSDITSVIFFANDIEEAVQPLTEITIGLKESTELLSRVRSFLGI